MDEITTFPQPIDRLRLEELNTNFDQKTAPQASYSAGELAKRKLIIILG